MDKSWIHHHARGSEGYNRGIRNFIKLANRHKDGQGRIRCPCRLCKNTVYKPIKEVEKHLFQCGMYKSYTNWIWHGEGTVNITSTVNTEYDVNTDNGDNADEGRGNEDNVFELLDNVRMGTFTNAEQAEDPLEVDVGDERFKKLLNDAQCELWPGCQKNSKLSAILKLFHMKVVGRMTNKSFDMLLKLLKEELLPDDNTLPKSYYETKSLLRDLGLGYDSIYACKNDCALFWKENEGKKCCPQCGESRYKSREGKGKKIPQKVLRYFPLKHRLQQLFMSRDTAVDMRWHKEKCVKETNVLRHPADSKAWEEFDNKHSWFATDPRNVRLGLACDGFNPFGNMSNAYSMWPVIIVPYNLPPWICMKEPYMFMSLLIPGPKSPGNDIDVYLRPLIDELKELWMDGVMTYDAYSKSHFNMHAGLIWTIHDFPAYAMTSGWMTKGYMACPNCNKRTCSCYLSHGKKICYLGTRIFLSSEHAYRKRYKQFNGEKEERQPPKQLIGDDILEQLNLIPEVRFGKGPNNKKRTRGKEELNWTKKSIFFELPYWRTLLLRHNLDVMHIEKNICDNVLGTLMNIEGKTKDTFKSRMDLEEMGIRKELHLRRNGEKFEMPPARYTLSKDEKRQLCDWLKSVKIPDGYASNISRCVNVNECKISGLKSHDSHVLLQRLLPLAIRGLLPVDICNAIAELGLFFKEMCCRTLKMDVLEALERDIAVIICKLEMIFPPSFFDIMVHLAMHLPREAIIAGPAQYRWMYPIERFLHTLKSYVRNKARPEGSIAEAYVDNECVTFCASAHKATLEQENTVNVQSRHAKEFPRWLETLIKEERYHNKSTINDDLYSLACGPESRIHRYSGCIVNGVRFHTKEREKNRRTQNSGVLVKTEDLDYYGVLTDIIELQYPLKRRVVLFKCDWFNTKTGIKNDTYFRSINIARKWYKDEPFVLANQAKQAFFVKDSKLRGTWEVIQDITHRSSYDVPEMEDDSKLTAEMCTAAYQEDEPCIVDRVIEAANFDMDPLPLNRDGLEVESIDAEIILKTSQESRYEFDFLEDNDEISIEDNSDEEEKLLSEDDTDLDDM
ncbi:uncharacterized protein LOC132278633 [Cornus florida]|uniref:uncharacterized protein LOC132278633 n=1 Tax=Cornus florida TaxID=4283 RepID=UPI0028A09CC8|nr:uncharacterized protein LOC132278633 [Cornus florida]